MTANSGVQTCAAVTCGQQNGGHKATRLEVGFIACCSGSTVYVCSPHSTIQAQLEFGRTMARAIDESSKITAARSMNSTWRISMSYILASAVLEDSGGFDCIQGWPRTHCVASRISAPCGRCVVGTRYCTWKSLACACLTHLPYECMSFHRDPGFDVLNRVHTLYETTQEKRK